MSVAKGRKAMKLKLAIATALLTTALVSGPTANQDVQLATVNSTSDAMSLGLELMEAPQLASSIDLETVETREIVAIDEAGLASAVISDDAVLASLTSERAIDVDAIRKDAEARAIAAAKMPPHLFSIAEAGGDADVELVVRHSGASSLSDEQLEAMDAEVVREFHSMDMRAVRIPADALMAYALDNQIDWISPDEKVFAMSESAHGSANEPTATQANYAFTGSGVGIAVVDSGVASHVDLPNGILQFDFRDPSSMHVDTATQSLVPSLTGTIDGFGHGTHISGTIRGSGVDSHNRYRGIAPGADIVSLQVLNADGSGQSSAVIAALDWLLVNAAQYNIRVVNLSLGRGVTESNTTDPLVLAAERLWDAGIVVVAAAGNDGHSGNMTINSPGNSRKVITVGSLTDAGTGNDASDDYASTFSSRGPSTGDLVLKPDLLAPGNKIVAAISSNQVLAQLLPTRHESCTRNGCNSMYLEMSGTSMATGVVSAAVALMLEKSPNLTPDTVKARLMRSARKMDDEPTTVGAGTLNINAALNDTGHVYRTALSPLMIRSDATDGILVEDTGQLWGHSRWAASVLYQGATGWQQASTGSGLGLANGDVSANGFLWTDEGVWARGFLWTDEDVWARGFLWTDEVGARSFLESDGNGTHLNDDP